MTPEEIMEKLRKPFPREAIKQRVGGGGRRFDYVEGHSVINRLNEATGGVWDFKVLGLDRHENLLTATVEITIPGLGSKQHIGVQAVSAGGGEDLVKGAVTDALKKAATLFGVAIELYGPDYETDDPRPAQTFEGAVREKANVPTSQTGSQMACAECGAALTKGQYDLSIKKFNRPLCPAHQR